MAKGKFSAQIWKGWFSKNRHERFKGEELVIGVDCAKIAFYATVMAGSWHTFDIIYFERDEIGAVLARFKELDFKRIVLVVEPTGTYSDVLIEQARVQGIEVVRINGERVHGADKVFDGVPSLHDGKAAYLLGRLYFCEVGSPWEVKSVEDRELRALVNMDQVSNSLMQQLLGPLEAYLARHWPELTNHLDLTGATLLELVSTYGTPQAVAAHEKEAARLMRKVGKSLLKEEKIQAVLESAKKTQGVVATDHELAMLRFYGGVARDIRGHQNNAQRQLEKRALEDARTRPLVEFTGKRSAVYFVALLGAFTNYDKSAMLEKAMGLNLCERSTGKTHEDKQRNEVSLHISKRGSPKVRTMLYFLALRLLNPRTSCYCPEAVAWYGERLQRNGGIKLKAIIALMRKLVDALWWVARGEAFDPHKLFDVPRLQRLGYLDRD